MYRRSDDVASQPGVDGRDGRAFARRLRAALGSGEHAREPPVERRPPGGLCGRPGRLRVEYLRSGLGSARQSGRGRIGVGFGVE